MSTLPPVTAPGLTQDQPVDAVAGQRRALVHHLSQPNVAVPLELLEHLARAGMGSMSDPYPE